MVYFPWKSKQKAVTINFKGKIMKFIFLDIDGVLNCESVPVKYVDMIDDERVKLLKEIVNKTGAEIILSSSWKVFLEDDLSAKNSMGKDLVGMLSKHGLHISNKTNDWGILRGEGIRNFLNTHECEGWVVLDDDIFEDYEEFGIMPHLVKTYFYRKNGGLRKSHVEKAIRILNSKKI